MAKSGYGKNTREQARKQLMRGGSRRRGKTAEVREQVGAAAGRRKTVGTSRRQRISELVRGVRISNGRRGR